MYSWSLTYIIPQANAFVVTDPHFRIAIVGAGPAGFYTAGHLLKRKDLAVSVDMFDVLPTPFGLVRSGVAPDHQKIKRVTRVYDKTARSPYFRFMGNVEYGRHLILADLQIHYHAVCFTTGAQIDRRLGIPGENLGRSYSATDFVAWYNGHPAYRDLEFDLSQEKVAVIGVGNVAVDVCRILCRTTEELARTDIADYALEALSRSRIRNVYMLGRRGPGQAAFTNPEAKELGELIGADIHVPPSEAEPDAVTIADPLDRATTRKLAMIKDFSRRPRKENSQLLTIRFKVSPVLFYDDGTGNVGGLRLAKNKLFVADDARIRCEPKGEYEELPASVVFRSVGYRGVPLDGLPFDTSRGIVPNTSGRVLNPSSNTLMRGIYVAGWIKRGPTGVIGTNKADALETVRQMVDDLMAKRHLEPADPSIEGAERTIAEHQPDVVSWSAWEHLNAIEEERGAAAGRPRVKFTSVEDMLGAIAPASSHVRKDVQR